MQVCMYLRVSVLGYAFTCVHECENNVAATDSAKNSTKT